MPGAHTLIKDERHFALGLFMSYSPSLLSLLQSIGAAEGDRLVVSSDGRELSGI